MIPQPALRSHAQLFVMPRKEKPPSSTPWDWVVVVILIGCVSIWCVIADVAWRLVR